MEKKNFLYSLKKISYAKHKVNTQRLWDYLFYDYKNRVPQSIFIFSGPKIQCYQSTQAAC